MSEHIRRDLGKTLQARKMFRRLFSPEYFGENFDRYEESLLKGSYLRIFEIALDAEQNANTFDELFDAIQKIVIDFEETGFFDEVSGVE